jgi:hypothetical protein
MADHMEDAAALKKFREAVNMTASEIEHWLETDHSKEVGQKNDGESESTGHQSGRHIVGMLRAKLADYSTGDYAQMRRVVSFVHRHLTQRPPGDISESHWRYSLMNWGHDPLKK